MPLLKFLSLSAPKPLRDWTVEEVQNWFREGRFCLYAKHFHNLTGGDLANFAKEDYRALCPEMGFSIYYDLQAVQASYVKAILPQKEHDPALPDPSDSRWDYLHNIKALERKIGETIELPDLSGSAKLLPKELQPHKLQSFILTPQRYALLKEFADVVHLGQKDVVNTDVQAGMILSGPNGVGKTAESYLLASVAYINGAILIYMPKTAEWASLPNDNAVAQYVLKRFCRFNSFKAWNIKCQSDNNWGSENLLELALVGVRSIEQALLVHFALLQELQGYIEAPVVFVVDEHNEIWWQHKESSPFFRQYMISTGLLQGARTFTLLSGSAHSRFEFNLQPGLERWLRRIQPFPLTIFEKAIAPGGVFELPPAWQKDTSDKILLAEITGRMPREMGSLQQAHLTGTVSMPLEWVGPREKALAAEVNKFVDKHKGRLDEFLAFMEIIFSPQYAANQEPSPESMLLHDTGLIIYDQEQHRYRCTSLPAERALLSYYYKKVPQTPISRTKPAAEQGLLLEKWVERQLYDDLSNLPAYTLGNISGDPITLRLPAIQLRKFFRANDIPTNVTRYPCFYIPLASNFAGWDLIIHEPLISQDKTTHRVIFIQCSINSVRKHDKASNNSGKLAKTFAPRGKNPSLVKALIEGITGLECKGDIYRNGKLEVTSEGLDVQFLYVTAAPREQLIKEEASNPKPKYENLFVVPREICESDLHIPFIST
ncbi:hypothetical protein QOT17_007661 [Balamuthia mandrillaris]